MAAFFRRFLLSVNRNSVLLALAFMWFMGSLFGIILTEQSGNSYYLLMRTAASSRVSIVGLIASVYLPFLLSAFAVYTNKPRFIYFICFVKAALLAQGALAVALAFGSASWLARFLLQFTDLLLAPVLCWFVIRLLSGVVALKRDFCFCSVIFLMTGSLDYCVVSPFLVMLIDK